jgi:hypothetical protein
MSTPLFSNPPSFDAIKPYLREWGARLLAWANAQDRRLPFISTASYRGACHSCPACGGWEIEGDHVSIEDGLALQDVSCLNCNAAWRDVYVLSGFDPLIIDHPSPSAHEETPDGLDRADTEPKGDRSGTHEPLTRRGEKAAIGSRTPRASPPGRD